MEENALLISQIRGEWKHRFEMLQRFNLCSSFCEIQMV